jgi:hypothetical protein
VTDTTEPVDSGSLAQDRDRSGQTTATPSGADSATGTPAGEESAESEPSEGQEQAVVGSLPLLPPG